MAIYAVRYEKTDATDFERRNARALVGQGKTAIRGGWSIPARSETELQQRIAAFLDCHRRHNTGTWAVTSVQNMER
jgi:hypothetical protein